MLVLAVSIVVKLINIQFVDGDYYIKLSENTTIKNLVIPANRGNVYSSNGKLLATSVPKYDIRFDALSPSDRNFDKYVKQLANNLASYYNKSEKYYYELLFNARKNKNRYLLIARNIGYNEHLKLKNFPLFNLGSYRGGIIIEQKTKRDYPFGGIAQRTIGYERTDDKGNITRPGIDGAFGSKYLKGIDGVRLSQKIGNGQKLYLIGKRFINPKLIEI